MFEQYVAEHLGTGRAGKNTLSVRSSGSIGIGKRLVEEHELQKFAHALLFYDKSSGGIGVKFLEEPQYGSTHIVLEGKGYAIHHIGFVQRYELAKGDYLLLRKEANGLFVFGREPEPSITVRYVLVEVPVQTSDADLSMHSNSLVRRCDEKISARD